MKRRLSVPNFILENKLPMFRLHECSSCHQGESKEIQINVSTYSHALLRIHIIGGQRSVWIVPLPLSPHHSGPATSPSSQLKCSSEGVMWMCRDSFSNSSCQCHGPALWSPPSGLDGDSPTHALVQLTSPSSPS